MSKELEDAMNTYWGVAEFVDKAHKNGLPDPYLRLLAEAEHEAALRLDEIASSEMEEMK